MNLQRISGQSLLLELTEAELITLKACLREAFATLHERDFPLRIGIRHEAASHMAKELSDMMHRLGVDE